MVDSLVSTVALIRVFSEKLTTLQATLSAYTQWAAVAAKQARVRRKVTSRSTGRHLAVLVSDFPPTITGGVYRPLSIIQYACASGWRATIITRETNAVPSGASDYLLSSLSANVKVIRVLGPEREPSFRWFPRIQGESLQHALSMIDVGLDTFLRDAPSAVFASGPLFNSFVAALSLSKTLKVPMVLDYRDEWTEWPFGIFPIGKSDHDWERRCVDHASAIFFTTTSQLENQMLAYPEVNRLKCHIVPNGWEPSDFSGLEIGTHTRRQARHDGRFLISYVGVFGGHIDVRGFLDQLDAVFSRRPDIAHRLLIRIIGAKDRWVADRIAASEHRESFELLDQVPKNVANRYMVESDSLLLVYTGLFGRYVPGKLYDYIAARRPILLYGIEGEATSIVRQLHAGLIVRPDETAELEQALDKLLMQSSAPEDDATIHEAWLRQHTRTAISQSVVEIIDTVLYDHSPQPPEKN